MQGKRNLADYAIILNEADNVATALVEMPKGDYVLPSCDATSAITLRERIQAGFKVALSDIYPGDKIYKYGYAIGVARVEIHPGDCVHIHNMKSSYSS